MHENYNAETGEGLAPTPEQSPDHKFTGFVGWNLLVQDMLKCEVNKDCELLGVRIVMDSASGPPREYAILVLPIAEPGWRNWQTQRTQNPPRLTPRGGSTPPPGTSLQ